MFDGNIAELMYNVNEGNAFICISVSLTALEVNAIIEQRNKVNV